MCVLGDHQEVPKVRINSRSTTSSKKERVYFLATLDGLTFVKILQMRRRQKEREDHIRSDRTRLTTFLFAIEFLVASDRALTSVSDLAFSHSALSLFFFLLFLTLLSLSPG